MLSLIILKFHQVQGKHILQLFYNHSTQIDCVDTCNDALINVIIFKRLYFIIFEYKPVNSASAYTIHTKIFMTLQNILPNSGPST